MAGLDPQFSTAENYRVFGREARGRSLACESLAAPVADDTAILEFRAALRILVQRNGTELALIEVGASASSHPAVRPLTPTTTRAISSYDYQGHLIAGSDPDAPVLHCAVRGRPANRPPPGAAAGSAADAGAAAR